MNPQLLLTHFGRIANAPDAIQHLRPFILDLAVRGKLVDQDPADEPASKLLSRIRAEKVRLANAGEIKKDRSLPVVDPNEEPFRAPAGWEWVRIRHVTSDRGQTTPDSDFTYIDVTAINKEVGCIADAKVLAASDAPSRARKKVRTGDVLYSCVRPYLRNIAIIEDEIVPAPIASTAFAVLNGFGLVLARYLWIALRSPFMIECVERKMRGQAYPAINDADFALLPLPLPPLTEQRRIVAKVDELMVLCDQLEESQTERRNRLDRLAAASLHRLNNEANAEEFRNHAHFYLQHLPRITINHEQLHALRQSVLNLAVRGMLVAPDEECSLMELLEVVKTERLQLSSTNSDLAATAAEFEELEQQYHREGVSKACIPMRCACHFITKGTTPAPEKLRQTGDIPFLKVYNIVNNRLDFNYKPTFIPRSVHDNELRRSKVYPGDVLMNIVGPPLGKVAVVTDQYPEWNVNQAIAIFRPLSSFASRFLMIVLSCSTTIAQVLKETRGVVGQDNLSLEQVRTLSVPLVPMSYQHRVVAKVDELMALCDLLETQLATAQFESRRLLDAVLHGALKDKDVPVDEVEDTPEKCLQV